VKVGVSASSAEAGEALRLFDYVETYDSPIQGQAYHSRCAEGSVRGSYLYIVRHLDCSDLSLTADSRALYENVYSMSYEETVRRLGDRAFLLDVGHAFISDMKGRGQFELERWLGLSPVAVHIHNVRYVPDPTGRIANAPYADHQPLNEGLIDMREALREIARAGIEYVTVEVFFRDYTPTAYPLAEKRRWVDELLRGLEMA